MHTVDHDDLVCALNTSFNPVLAVIHNDEGDAAR
jgi:hypothetical protein